MLCKWPKRADAPKAHTWWSSLDFKIYLPVVGGQGCWARGDAFQALAEFDEQASAGWHILDIKVLLMYIDYTG
jgi:hypothetical protein